MSDNSIDAYSFLRFLLKNPAHSVHVFLLPTQKTAEMPTINVIRYFIINKASSGRVSVFTCKKISISVINLNYREIYTVNAKLEQKYKSVGLMNCLIWHNE